MDRTCLTYTEQFLIDAHGVDDAQTDAVSTLLSPAGLVALTVALGMFETSCRLQLLFSPTDTSA